MAVLTTAAILGLLALGGSYLGDYFDAKSGSEDADPNNVDVSSLPKDIQDYWNSLPYSTKKAYLSQYKNTDQTLWGRDVVTYDEDALLKDLANTTMFNDYAVLGDEPLLEDYYNSAKETVDAETAQRYADLDKLLAEQTSMYNDQLNTSRTDYNSARTQLLSQQYQQGAQLMDTYRSEMDRSRRNALEAGASAGIRIADNINTLLSVQNKQAATSLETSNQLAQMMMNQRKSEYDLQNRYSEYKAQDTYNRHAISDAAFDKIDALTNRDYGIAKNTYDTKKTELDNKYSGSALAGKFATDYNKYQKSKYSQ